VDQLAMEIAEERGRLAQLERELNAMVEGLTRRAA
jgi:hypothetical protein